MDTIKQALDRQERRRKRGIPAVTTIAGPVERVVAFWTAWAQEQGRETVCVGTQVDDVTTAWLCHVLDRLPQAVLRYIAEQEGVSAEELTAFLQLRSDFETLLFWERYADRLNPYVLDICREWIRHEIHVRGSDPRRGASSTEFLESLLPDNGRNLSPVSTILGCDHAPTVLLVVDEFTSDAVGRLANSLVTAVTMNPWLTAGLAIQPQALADVLRHTPSHVAAVLRESVVQFEMDSRPKVRNARREDDVSSALTDALRKTGINEPPESLHYYFFEAKRACESVTEHSESTITGADKARSACERFLYELLQQHPQTAGLFQLAVKPGFAFGGRRAELDLACQPLHIAIEVDGYFHFLSMDNYRRDRRKDFLLQQHGYFVLRFLAEDIVAKPDCVLETVLKAVALKRQSSAK